MNRIKQLLLIVTAFVTLSLQSEADNHRDFDQIVLARNLMIEEHQVLTADGFILTVYRIPGSFKDKNKNKPPIVLVHGLIDSSDCWVINDDNSPAFILAKAGYDVWIPNSRGNKRSKRHIKYSTSDPEFWDYSWEDNGEYDLPAITDYVLSQTGFKKLAYIGQSMGTTQAFYAMSQNPEYYKEKWQIMIALAPPITCEDVTNQLAVFMSTGTNAEMFEQTMKYLKQYEVAPANQGSSYVVTPVCTFIPDLCKFADKTMADDDPEANDFIASNNYFSHYPSGGSVKQFVHYAQVARVNTFQRYDYGTVKNIQKYGQEKPPEIDLRKIKDIPVGIFAGSKDILATVTNARRLRETLGDNVVFYGEYELGHLSFFTAKDMSYFSQDVMSLLSKYYPSNYSQTQ